MEVAVLMVHETNDSFGLLHCPIRGAPLPSLEQGT